MTDDVFETMTRVKRHFSDTTMHIKQVDFSGADRAEKIKTQFKGVVGEVLSRGLPESAAAKNVTLIEDFFEAKVLALKSNYCWKSVLGLIR